MRHTALHYAVANNELDTVRRLLKFGANINAQTCVSIIGGERAVGRGDSVDEGGGNGKLRGGKGTDAMELRLPHHQQCNQPRQSGSKGRRQKISQRASGFSTCCSQPLTTRCSASTLVCYSSTCTWRRRRRSAGSRTRTSRSCANIFNCNTFVRHYAASIHSFIEIMCALAKITTNSLQSEIYASYSCVYLYALLPDTCCTRLKFRLCSSLAPFKLLFCSPESQLKSYTNSSQQDGSGGRAIRRADPEP